jgi:hypothetical protein
MSDKENYTVSKNECYLKQQIKSLLTRLIEYLFNVECVDKNIK